MSLSINNSNTQVNHLGTLFLFIYSIIGTYLIAMMILQNLWLKAEPIPLNSLNLPTFLFLFTLKVFITDNITG
ncbi:hypothetical protein K502DRAFT_348708 [Neoconidiobolus thromboides FSU 785]|nr:hypothetical protein K502DRAFT_348708 [Neoconidiobolus thromboides FSU 785]